MEKQGGNFIYTKIRHVLNEGSLGEKTSFRVKLSPMYGCRGIPVLMNGPFSNP